jgi:hypothetical protein
MYDVKTFGGSIGLIAVLSLIASTAWSDDGVDRLIDGVVSRSSTIHSMQVTYTQRSYTLQSGRTTDESTFRARMVVDGSDWAIRYDKSRNFRMQRGNAGLSFVETQSDADRTFRTLYVEEPKSLEELIYENPYFAAVRLGGFLYGSQSEFIDRHRQQAVVRGERQAGSYATTELEFPVAAADFHAAMLIIPQGIGRARRGRLRIGVAPALGFALPRIEYVTDEGVVEHEIVADEFVDEGNGVFFPRRAQIRTRGPQSEDVAEFVIHDVSGLNLPMHADAFTMKIPLGTWVNDSRPGVPPTSFEVKNQQQLDELHRALGRPQADSARNWRRLLLTVNSLCFVVCLTLYVIRRCMQSS